MAWTQALLSVHQLEPLVIKKLQEAKEPGHSRSSYASFVPRSLLPVLLQSSRPALCPAQAKAAASRQSEEFMQNQSGEETTGCSGGGSKLLAPHSQFCEAGENATLSLAAHLQGRFPMQPTAKAPALKYIKSYFLGSG